MQRGFLAEVRVRPSLTQPTRPDEGNLPAGLTLDQFKLVMRTGIDLDKAHPLMGPLLQVAVAGFGKRRPGARRRLRYLLHIPHVETAKPKT
jgi:hypothetical protein